MHEETVQEGTLQKSIRAGKWLTIDFLVQKLIAFLPFFILARLLTPEDFGLVAIILLVPHFLQVVSEHGLTTAAIQKGGDVNKYLNPIWTLNALRGVLIAGVMFLLAPFIASFYHVEAYVWPVRFGGLIVLIHHFTNIGEIWFTKDLDFKKVFLRNTARSVAYAVVAITLAVTTHSYWSLLIAQAAMQITETIATYVLQPYRPRLSFRFGLLKELTGFSKWIMGQTFADQIYGFAEQSIVARTTNTASVGLYTKAKNLASVGPGFIASIISMIAFPAFARIKEDPKKVQEGLKRSMDLLFVVTMPIIVLILAAGGKLVLILLGEPWLPITNALRIFVLYFTIFNLTDICYKALSGIGHPDIKVKFDGIKISLSIVLLLIAAPRWGATGAAGALFLGFFPVLVLSVRALILRTTVTAWNILIRAGFPLSVAMVLLVPAIIWKEAILGFSIISLGMLALAYIFFYALIIVAVGKKFNRGPYSTLLLIAKTAPRV